MTLENRPPICPSQITFPRRGEKRRPVRERRLWSSLVFPGNFPPSFAASCHDRIGAGWTVGKGCWGETLGLPSASIARQVSRFVFLLFPSSLSSYSSGHARYHGLMRNVRSIGQNPPPQSHFLAFFEAARTFPTSSSRVRSVRYQSRVCATVSPNFFGASRKILGRKSQFTK